MNSASRLNDRTRHDLNSVDWAVKQEIEQTKVSIDRWDYTTVIVNFISIEQKISFFLSV